MFWGAAIVIFLAKIINLHNSLTQGFWVEVSSQIENGMSVILGALTCSHNCFSVIHRYWHCECVIAFLVSSLIIIQGLIPWRVVDTYRILRIRRFKSLTRKLRARAGLPELFDEDDLPDPMYDPNYVHVLTEKQEKELHHRKMSF